MYLALVLLLSLSGLFSGCDVLFPRRTEGEKLYRKYCSKCHGIDAAGNTPRYMGNPWADLRDEHWKLGGDAMAIEDAIRQGVGEMPAFDDLSRKEIRQIINHLRHLRGETPLRSRD